METPLFQDIAHKSDYYFVHSFHFQPEDSSTILATTPYCGQFVSVVGRGRVWGTQFHPEKSQKSGFQLIRNFLTL
jgi:glutamine amidotransferase